MVNVLFTLVSCLRPINILVNFNCIGNACQFKVVGQLKKKFKCPLDARLRKTTTAEVKSVDSQTTYIPAVDSSVQCNILQTVDVESVGVQTDSCRLPVPLGDDALDQQLIQLDQAFAKAAMKTLNVTVPQDFLESCCRAMVQLKKSGKSNVLYKLAKGFGTLRTDFSDS